MHLLFNLFRGGIICEVCDKSEAKIAQKAGAVAVLMGYEYSPILPGRNDKNYQEIRSSIQIPIIASFKPGHLIEAEILLKMGLYGVYADSRFEPIQSISNFYKLLNDTIPLIADIDNLEQKINNLTPVVRGETLEKIIEIIKQKNNYDLLFTAGPVESVSDIALLRRIGADTIILPNDIFGIQNPESNLEKLVKASIYFDNTEKLTEIIEKQSVNFE